MGEERPVYRIRDWQKHFENHESRKVKSLAWVPVKNKHDGAGYRRVAALPNSVQVFCGWCLIIQVASRMPTRGVLRDDDGALDPADLAAKTGYPETVFKAAFDALTDPRIRWLELDSPGDSPGNEPNSGNFRDAPGENGVEQKGTEQNTDSARTSLDEGVWVERIQNAYPDRSWASDTASWILSAIRSGTPPETILQGTKEAAILIAKNYPSGIRNQYVPKARSFFEGRLWESPEIHFPGRQEGNGSKPTSKGIPTGV